ncbi:hypothetical protein MA16_Dca023132 [Dendrobium catenatum]|uniref:Uncharacterized protein n=1 Tax=Dendrobium catenatum TaxID=906689 RepID=A0A2I0VEU1_9ASPA|nr:hypothetical protein MA16_Dca023132 [Dendrobium catenatum]
MRWRRGRRKERKDMGIDLRSNRRLDLRAAIRFANGGHFCNFGFLCDALQAREGNRTAIAPPTKPIRFREMKGQQPQHISPHTVQEIEKRSHGNQADNHGNQRGKARENQVAQETEKTKGRRGKSTSN